jgi:hypothetical protein
MKTRNEKILFAVLLAVAFGTANFYGYEWIAQQQHVLDLHEAELRADQAEAEVDLQKQELWSQRKSWIEKNQPVMADEGDTKAQVLGSALKSARDQDLEILEQNLGDVSRGPGGACVNVELRVRGSTAALCRWLAGLEKPASFYAVSKISLKADQDEKSMVCSVQLARYFKATP